MDESTRRYYLDTMGIQCWQLLDVESSDVKQPEPGQPEIEQPKIEQLETNSQETQGEVQAVAENAEVYKQSVNVDAAASGGSWSKIDSDIKQCEHCQLHKARKQAISGRGNRSADIMFVFLAASADDDKAGVLCSGESEALFSRMLAAIDIAFDDVYITALLKCSVPLNHTVSPKEIQSCNIYLKQQIQLVKPKLIVILGETAIRCLMQKNLSLDEYREMNSEAALQFDSVPLFVSYSPQELLLHPENKRKAWSDLQTLQSAMQAVVKA